MFSQRQGVDPHMTSLSLKLLQVQGAVVRMSETPQSWPCSEEAEKRENQESCHQIPSSLSRPHSQHFPLCGSFSVLPGGTIAIQFTLAAVFVTSKDGIVHNISSLRHASEVTLRHFTRLHLHLNPSHNRSHECPGALMARHYASGQRKTNMAVAALRARASRTCIHASCPALFACCQAPEPAALWSMSLLLITALKTGCLCGQNHPTQ